MPSTLYAAVLFSLFASPSFEDFCSSHLVLNSSLGLCRASVRTRVHEGQDDAFLFMLVNLCGCTPSDTYVMDCYGLVGRAPGWMDDHNLRSKISLLPLVSCCTFLEHSA